MKFNSESNITIVTGAAQGIGKAITLRVLREGLSVLALDKDAEALAELKLECNDKKDRSLLQTYELDLSQVSQIELLFTQLTINNIRPYALVAASLLKITQPKRQSAL